ncbi:MAG: FAD:protein FMN transferase [Actinomycetota bacterium]|nr:FAD:protein FMN transferase [Actinomycetota bacterium]
MSRRAWVEQIMGMPVSIHLRGDGVRGREAERAVAAAFAELGRMDRLFSTYDPHSQLSRFQRGELSLAQADPLLAESLERGRHAERVTGGAFTLMLPDDTGALRLDPTGLVKGWAVDRAAVALHGLAGTSWCINAGGDVLVGHHRHLPPRGGDAGPWRVGVEDPRDRRMISAVVPLTEGAVATSGTAARGAHLYDPAHGSMVGRAGSQTVVGSTLLWADVWATALFVGGPETAAAFSHKAPGCQTFAA